MKVLIALVCIAAAIAAGPGGYAASAPGKPVLVELFSSEGCSDCPPADKLLTELTKTQEVAGAQIIGLEEHVNHWNNPAHWVDPFSSSQATNRQYDYAARFNDDSPYTPEMVVDGSVHFVGSDRNSALAAVRSAEATPAASIVVSASLTSPKTANVTVQVSAISPTLLHKKVAVLLVVSEDDLISHITGGENRGTTLHHSNVALTYSFLGYLGTTGSYRAQTAVTLASSSAFHRFNCVALIQDTVTKCIYGCGEGSL